MNNQEFINILTTTFPEIKEDILSEDNDGLITLQVGEFKRYAQKAIDNNDVTIIKKCFQFFDDVIENVDFRIENALYLSFLNKLNFNNNAKATKLLSRKSLKIKLDLDSYNNSEPNAKVNKFLSDN